ncbi:T7SS effector LXG polymorphic toxin, partial [Streptococcus oralis]|uniref:T7SS effector LXG polymorphic toxin n=1 Tax=Streptococcus oralis TaxID=1303 RepID=UPI0022846837
MKSNLTKARSSLSQVVSTDSLKGVVKDTINQKVSNYQIPLLDNYSNALDSIVNRYDGIIKLFKETVGETNDSAIINTEYLERVKQRMKDPIEGLSKISTRTQSIYSDISDIISLGNPSLDDVNTIYAKAQKSLDDTIKNMEMFNNVILNTDTFDLIDMQNSEIATLSGYAPLPYGDRVSRNYYNRTQFKNSVSEIHTAIHSNSKAVKYQNALAKQLAESKYSGTVAENENLIDSLFNVYKNVTKSDLYKNSKGYTKYLKSILPALYAAYRFSQNKKGDTIVLKETTKFGELLDNYFEVSKKLSGSRTYKVVQYKNGGVPHTFKSIMKKLGYTKYNEELSKVFKSFTDTTRFSTKVASVGKSIVSTTGSLLKEEFIKEITFKGAGKGLWSLGKAGASGGFKGLVKSATDSFKNYKEGFKSATKFGKFLKGAAVVGVALDVVDTFSKISENEKEAKRQDLRGNEVKASVTTGFVIDAAKAAGTTVAATAAASAGAAFVGLVATATAPAWLAGGAAILASAGAVAGLNWLDKKFNVTDNLKKGANSLIKGM